MAQPLEPLQQIGVLYGDHASLHRRAQPGICGDALSRPRLHGIADSRFQRLCGRRQLERELQPAHWIVLVAVDEDAVREPVAGRGRVLHESSHAVPERIAWR
jgi:hypothetical protein